MKNLLKHVTSPDLTVSAVFEHLYSSFTREEDSSVVERMKPGKPRESQFAAPRPGGLISLL
jgi:hypothetical protein